MNVLQMLEQWRREEIVLRMHVQLMELWVLDFILFSEEEDRMIAEYDKQGIE